MKVLITGGAGFIGSKVAQQLIDRGDEVVILDNFNDYYDPKLKIDRLQHLLGGKQYALYLGDVRDSNLLDSIFTKEKIDKVVHFANMAGARDSVGKAELYMDVNVGGMVNMLEMIKKHEIKNFVYASSSSVYGDNEKIPFSETDPINIPVSPYAASKRSAELIAHTYHHLYGMKMSMLRFFTVYGPWGRPDMGVFKFVANILEGKTIDVYNNGQMRRNFTYIDDIVSGTITVLDADLKCDIVNIGGAKDVGLMEYIHAVEKHAGKKAQMNMMPMQAGDAMRTIADTYKLQSLGWEPTTAVDEGVAEFVKWYKEYYTKK